MEKKPEPSQNLSDARRIAIGTYMGFTAAAAYAVAIMVLRHLADRGGVDWAIWVSAVKAAPAALVAVSLGLANKKLGQRFFPPWRYAAPILLSGIFMQFGSNVGFQWSLSQTGMAISVPVSYASMLLLSAWMSKQQLGEHIPLRSVVAMGILMVAIALLSGGARNARSDLTTLNLQTLTLSILAALIAGVGWAWTGIVIRRAVTNGVPVAATVFIFSISGVLGLGATTVSTRGLGYISAVTGSEYGWMVLAGSFNALAFFMLTAALKHIPVVRNNLINASQIAMTTVAGILVFGERATAFLMGGTALTIVGLFIMGGRDKGKPSDVPAQFDELDH